MIWGYPHFRKPPFDWDSPMLRTRVGEALVRVAQGRTGRSAPKEVVFWMNPRWA
jgi:hypothetical protein